VVATAIAAVVLTAIACWAIVQYLMWSTAEERANTLARIIASNAPAVLSLRDTDRADELLRAAAQAHHLVSARIVERHGTVLANYTRAGASGDVASAWTRTSSVARPVEYGGENLGHVEVRVDSALVASIPGLFILACVALAAAFWLVVWMCAKPVERYISRPITSLAVFTRRIRDTQNYSLRVPQSSVKEMRGLVDDFNAMICEIEKTSNAQTHKSAELSKLAYFDQLTGAANRTRFRERISQSVEAYHREDRPFAIIGIDLDYFKQLNDTLGHNIGDQYLQAATARCMEVLRPEDTFARMGGDEFMVILPGVASAEDARVIGLKLGEALRSANSVHTGSVQCSGSIGVGLYPRDGKSASELMHRVDSAIYEAKRRGRNCVEMVGREQR
jgi:diguanylate cyclase (GGDEF)-like protein